MFFTRKKRDTETIEQYVNELRRLSATCEFGNLNDSLIKDQIILGISDKVLKDRHLRTQNLDLKTAIATCKASEQAEKQRTGICDSFSTTSVQNHPQELDSLQSR